MKQGIHPENYRPVAGRVDRFMSRYGKLKK